MEELKRRNQKKLGRHWISDMSLWHAWARDTRRPVLIRDRLPAEGAIYDSCIEHIRGFEAVNPLPLLVRPWKRLVFDQGRAYAFRKDNGQRRRLLCVHYHGRFKALMARHARGQADSLGAALLLLRLKLAALPEKARRAWRGYAQRLRPGR